MILLLLELSLLLATSLIAHEIEENGQRWEKNMKKIWLDNYMSFAGFFWFKLIIHWFYSFNRYVLGIYCVPGSNIDSMDPRVEQY